MFKLEYNGVVIAEADDIEYAKVQAAEGGEGLTPPMMPWADELDAEGKPSGVIASGYWRIVPTA